jgi:hypothetical protein
LPEFAPGPDEWTPPSEPARARPLAPREACARRDARRIAFFGDLHVHTGYSFDTAMRGGESTPEQAYRFARGEPIGLAPYDIDGEGTRQHRLERPLDFAAVTDHAEWLGEVSLCSRSGSPSHDTDGCQIFRGDKAPDPPGAGGRMTALVGQGQRRAEICGPDDRWCRAEAESIWDATQRAAEHYQDRSSACSFTTFHAWEYSASPGYSKVHRNIILRNEIVPELPISWVDEPSAENLWRKLKQRCNDTDSGCEAFAIPQNSNLSNGQMFAVRYRDRAPEAQRAAAALRAELEPLVEMTQAKGDSECRTGMYGVVGGEDELCDFEKVRYVGGARPPDCGDGRGGGALVGRGCQSRLDFVRYALIEGLRERARIGINPYRFGLIGGTDTHNGTPGAVDEATYPGHNATLDASLELRLGPAGRRHYATYPLRSPGGLMGVWAEDNSRDALFDAMKRRETFATSGPRIQPRLFAGWDLPADLCSRHDFVAGADAAGVPMGALLPARPKTAAAPVFAAAALRDPGTASDPGTPLQRIQIIKAWSDADGTFHEAVHDIAGEPDSTASVDPDTCESQGPGADSLCSIWTDPDFDPQRAAVYYVRVLENPSCRWNGHQCAALPESARPADCDAPSVPKTLQERAWTSPIWYEPAEASLGPNG